MATVNYHGQKITFPTIQGPQGIQGPIGITGARGPTGPAGNRPTPYLKDWSPNYYHTLKDNFNSLIKSAFYHEHEITMEDIEIFESCFNDIMNRYYSIEGSTKVEFNGLLTDLCKHRLN